MRPLAAARGTCLVLLVATKVALNPWVLTQIAELLY